MGRRAGLDGGQSQFRLRDTTGGAPLTRPGVSWGTADVVAETAAAAVSMLDELGADTAWERLVMGLTADPTVPETRAELAERVLAAADVDEVWVTGDDITAHIGALDGGEGVSLTVGTGVACVVSGSGHVRSLDGAGYLIGDEGGGFWLGSRGLRAVVRAHEGRGPATALSTGAVARFGPLDGLARRVHASPRPVDAVAQFAVDVLDAAEEDPVAADLAARAADHLAHTATVARDGLGSEPVTIALGGRLTGHRVLRRLLEERLADATVVDAAGTSLDGACALAASGDPGPHRPHISIHRRRP